MQRFASTPFNVFLCGVLFCVNLNVVWSVHRPSIILSLIFDFPLPVGIFFPIRFKSYFSESECCNRICCGPNRGFQMHITMNDGRVRNILVLADTMKLVYKFNHTLVITTITSFFLFSDRTKCHLEQIFELR